MDTGRQLGGPPTDGQGLGKCRRGKWGWCDGNKCALWNFEGAGWNRKLEILENEVINIPPVSTQLQALLLFP